jgi:cell division protein FtsI (penicillin-binding protein 3)
MKKISSDLYIPVFDPTDYEIIRGKDIVTTINVPMQDVVHNELLRGLEEFNGKAAAAIIMEVATGRIKAISNLSRNAAGEIGEFENYGIAYSSEPGSTIKAASVLALFEDGLAEPSTIVDFSEGKKKFYGHWMHDSGNHGISKSTLQEALEKSSNVGIASVMDDKYNKSKDWSKFASKFEQFGLYDKANVEIEGEPSPIIKNPIKDKKDWYNTTIPWMAHGYEMQMTPLQVLKFYNAVANNGKLMQPQLVTSIVEGQKTIKKFDPIVQRENIAKAENIAKLQDLLAGVVTNGTGKGMKSSLYNFSGKTGTTKVGYSGGEIEYNASFAGYWPSESPKYSMIVVVYGLKGSTYYGNLVAGPIFKRIMDWCYTLDQSDWIARVSSKEYNGRYRGSLYGYSSDFEKIFENGNIPYANVGRWVKGRSGDHGEVLNGKAMISTTVVPDVSGMGPRDAIYVLENLGMRVKLDGYGRVAKQSIRAGNKIENREITLYLN